ncbi:MAG TPA: MBOAT family protein, partial [Candidatus Saccharimonadales bacterium]|nr:MBOAT family protein [Candidatus Saccharimonadales bacterium]
VSDSRDLSYGARLWHVFGLVDTRQTTRVPPAIDSKALGKTIVYAVLAAIGLMVVTDLAPATYGIGYWLLRWLGGALFFYSLADAVEGGVRTLYRAMGIFVPRQQIVPIVSRSVQEFWGKRWNRAVGAWLRTHCFLPFARRRLIRTGFVAAFCASAVFHAYFTWVSVGGVMALAMVIFFLIQGGFVLLELRTQVTRWHPILTHAWTVAAVLGCSPLFIEPLLRILAV